MRFLNLENHLNSVKNNLFTCANIKNLNNCKKGVDAEVDLYIMRTSSTGTGLKRTDLLKGLK